MCEQNLVSAWLFLWVITPCPASPSVCGSSNITPLHGPRKHVWRQLNALAECCITTASSLLSCFDLSMCYTCTGPGWCSRLLCNTYIVQQADMECYTLAGQYYCIPCKAATEKNGNTEAQQANTLLRPRVSRIWFPPGYFFAQVQGSVPNTCIPCLTDAYKKLNFRQFALAATSMLHQIVERKREK